MVDNIEKRIDVPAWGKWSEKAKEYIPAKLKIPEEKTDKLEVDRNEAYKKTEWNNSTWEYVTQSEKTKLPNDVVAAIDQLDRSKDTKQGIRKAYWDMDTTIKTSKHEKWIGGFFGRIINKILNQ